MSTIRDIPWLRICAEGGAIVVSILLAFAIDAWWEARGERIDEQVIVSELSAEFSTAEAQIGELIADHEQKLQNFERLIELLSGDDVAANETEIFTLANDLWTISPYEPTMPVYQNLLESSGLDRISDDSIRKSLRLYEEASIRNREWDDTMKDLDTLYLVGTLSSRIPFIGSIMDSGAFRNAVRPSPVELAADLDFRNTVALRAIGERVLIVRRTRMLEAVRNVRDAVSASQ